MSVKGVFCPDWIRAHSLPSLASILRNSRRHGAALGIVAGLTLGMEP